MLTGQCCAVEEYSRKEERQSENANSVFIREQEKLFQSKVYILLKEFNNG